MVDAALPLAVVGGLDAVLVLAGVVALSGPRKELRFVPCHCARPECAGIRRVWAEVQE